MQGCLVLRAHVKLATLSSWEWACAFLLSHNDSGAAEDILNMSTVSNPSHPNTDDEEYSVIFNYEFIEDFGDTDTVQNDDR